MRCYYCNSLAVLTVGLFVQFPYCKEHLLAKQAVEYWLSPIGMVHMLFIKLKRCLYG